MKTYRIIAASCAAALLILGAFACKEAPSENTATATKVVLPDAEWLDDAEAVTEPPIDAGEPDACPRASAAYPPGTWLPRKPPRDGAFACESGQTSTAVAACEFQEGTCSTLGAKYVPCFFCLYTRETEANLGFRVFVPEAGVERLNFRGYALRAGASEACADALDDYAACLDVACACSRKATCYKKAKTGPCAKASDAIAAACESHAAATFLRPIIEANAFSTEDEAITMAKAFCGGS
jgi:hypothetical protein